ncbi:MAG: ribonuclease P protein component [Cyanobacteria bacterium P01_A01_bin.135]
MSLASRYRLKRRQDFGQLYRRGKRISAKYFTVRVLAVDHLQGSPNKDCPKEDWPSKVGVAVSLKVSKRAVVRNRIRRQVKAAMRQLTPRLTDGWLILITARAPAVECDYWQFLRELEELLTRAKVIHGHSGRGVL